MEAKRRNRSGHDVGHRRAGSTGVPWAEICQWCLMPAGLGEKPKRLAEAQDGFLRCELLLLRKKKTKTKLYGRTEDIEQAREISLRISY